MENIFESFEKEKIKSIVKWLYKLSPLELISTGCIIAIIICECTSVNEQAVIGNFLEQIGQIILTASSQAQAVDPNYISASLCQLKTLQKQIDYIKSTLKNSNYDPNS